MEKQHLQKQLEEKRGPLKRLYLKMLVHPKLLQRVAHLGEYLRFEGELCPFIKKWVILSTAKALDSEKTWQVHAKDPLLSPQDMQAIQEQIPPTKEPYLSIQPLLHAFMTNQPIPEESKQSAIQNLGEAGLYELMMVVGFYNTLIRSNHMLSL